LADIRFGSKADIGLARSLDPSRWVHFEQEHAIALLDRLKLDAKWLVSAGPLDSREVLKEPPLALTDNGREDRY